MFHSEVIDERHHIKKQWQDCAGVPARLQGLSNPRLQYQWPAPKHHCTALIPLKADRALWQVWAHLHRLAQNQEVRFEVQQPMAFVIQVHL